MGSGRSVKSEGFKSGLAKRRRSKTPRSVGFRVQGLRLGFRVRVSGFRARVQGLGFRLQRLGLKAGPKA